MDTLPFELNKEISKNIDVNIIRLVNKQLCLVNMDRFCNHIIEKLNYKDIDYLYDHYKHPFVINHYNFNTYYIKYNYHVIYQYDTGFLPNQRKYNKIYRSGEKVQIIGKYKLDLLSYDYLMTIKGCDKQSRINKLRDILNKQYQLTKNPMIDDYLWFMTNAIVMKLIDYTYDYDETHPRIIKEIKTEIDFFYGLISNYLKSL